MQIKTKNLINAYKKAKQLGFKQKDTLVYIDYIEKSECVSIVFADKDKTFITYSIAMIQDETESVNLKMNHIPTNPDINFVEYKKDEYITYSHNETHFNPTDYLELQFIERKCATRNLGESDDLIYSLSTDRTDLVAMADIAKGYAHIDPRGIVGSPDMDYSGILAKPLDEEVQKPFAVPSEIFKLLKEDNLEINALYRDNRQTGVEIYDGVNKIIYKMNESNCDCFKSYNLAKRLAEVTIEYINESKRQKNLYDNLELNKDVINTILGVKPKKDDLIDFRLNQDENKYEICIPGKATIDCGVDETLKHNAKGRFLFNTLKPYLKLFKKYGVTLMIDQKAITLRGVTAELKDLDLSSFILPVSGYQERGK